MISSNIDSGIQVLLKIELKNKLKTFCVIKISFAFKEHFFPKIAKYHTKESVILD